MSYLSPTYPSASAAFREGNILVVPVGAALPPLCVKCGQPAIPPSKPTEFRWHPRWVFLLILIGILFYAILALVLQKKARVAVPFCHKHRSWRTNMLIIGWTLFLAWIPEWIILAYLNVDGALIALLGIVTALAGLVIFSVRSSSFSPVFIDSTIAKFRGADESFLSRL